MQRWLPTKICSAWLPVNSVKEMTLSQGQGEYLWVLSNISFRHSHYKGLYNIVHTPNKPRHLICRLYSLVKSWPWSVGTAGQGIPMLWQNGMECYSNILPHPSLLYSEAKGTRVKDRADGSYVVSRCFLGCSCNYFFKLEMMLCVWF